jgi:hypothetical protein
MIFLALTIVFIILLEVGLYAVVFIQRRSFPWLITEADELPAFDSQALHKFLEYSFDPHLGWVRRPNSSGTENGQNGKITFNIDSSGSRSNSLEKSSPVMAAFGDSYAFCRQVEDDETWESQLAQQKSFGVMNFGVGNYGVDQALLRYKSMSLPETVQVVVMAFVPETICRIQSYWKHYLEFGNTFAFKPRFMLNSNDNLILLNNLIRGNEDYLAYREKLPEIQKKDGFYKKKFRSQQFRFPYLFSLMRNPIKQSLLISAVAIRGACRVLGISSAKIENLPFKLVMKRNLQDAHELYKEDKSKQLLNAILLSFRDEAIQRGHTPLIVVMPQLLDIMLGESSVAPYQEYFNGLAKSLPVIDLTNEFIKADFEKLYINDQYGGHLSVRGNSLVAKEISLWLKSQGL